MLKGRKMNSSNDTLDRIKAVVAKNAAIEVEKITPEFDLAEIDSLTRTELAMALEEEFSIQIPDQVLLNAKKLGDIIDFILQTQK